MSHSDYRSVDLVNAVVELETRRLVFADVVAAQDEGLSVLEARQRVSTKHNLPPESVKDIEREGIDLSWPPLGE